MDKKDLFYDILANPQLTPADFEAVGLTAENTKLQNKDYYKNNEKVRKEFMKNGAFDEKAFDNAYMLASSYYKGLADDSLNTNLIMSTSFDRDNIFVDPKLRKDDSNIPSIAITPNPLRQSQSLIEVGKFSDSGRSVDEIAQAEKILLNPVAVEMGEEPEWGESPNDEWLKNPFSTRVLAKWDSEGYHTDPLTGEEVHHEKDELKINSHDTYYYEDLDGRDIYGRQVLNKLNTITTDGSWMNKYDPFDSDDVQQKSIAGSLIKNLSLVGTMFIPYVGWGIAAASVIQQSVGLIGTLGKMLVGSDFPTLNAMEGFSRSWNRQTAKTQYAQENTLCWENFIDLIGDTTAQLREQRAIFKFVPAILKGKYGAMGNEGAELLKKEKTDALMKDLYSNTSQAELLEQMSKSGKPLDYIVKTLNSGIDRNMMTRIADKQVQDYFTKYNEIGEKVARAYMVGITVGDTYGEAKNAGASDAEAAWLTIGYAAAENKLLSTELGRWIFPELKGNRIKYKAIAKAVMGLPEEAKQVSKNLASASTTEKKNWVKKLFNLGKEAAQKDYSLLNKTAGAVLANGLGEGIEEVSEELLADFSKACFNTYREMTGQEAILDTFGHNWDWEDAAKRYGMSFFGGIIGGGINGAATDFTTLQDYKNIKSDQAMQQLVWMARNGELEDFYKTVNKMQLGATQIGTTKNEDGTWKVGTSEDNQDLEAKRVLRSTVQHIQDLVNAEGARLDDTSFIGLVLKANPNIDQSEVIKDFRTEAVANSSAAGRLLRNYNSLIKDIVDLQMQINNLMESFSSDSKQSKEVKEFKEGNSSNTTLNKVEELKKQLDEKRKLKDDIVKGKYTPELYRHALFESTYALAEGFTTATEEQYVKKYAHKSIDSLTQEEKEEWHNKYIEYCKSEKAEDMEFFADLYYDLAKATSKGLTESMDFYKQLREGQLNKIKALQNMSALAFKDVQFLLQNNGDISEIQNYLQNISKNVDGNFSFIADLVPAYEQLQDEKVSEDSINKVSELRQQYNSEEEASKKEDIQKQIDALDTKNKDIQNYLDLLEYGTSAVQNATGGLSKFIDRIKEIYADPSLNVQNRGNLLKNALFDNVLGELINSVKEAKKVGFIHPEVKNALKNALYDFQHTVDRFSLVASGDIAIRSLGSEYIDGYNQEGDDDFYLLNVNDFQTQINEVLDDLEALPNTPMQRILDTFTASLKTNKKVSQILREAINKQNEHIGDLENVAIADDAELYDYKQSLAVLKMIRQAIIGARVDNSDLDNLYGYNKTLNELTAGEEGTIKLAEIEQVDADYALQDINFAIARLEMIQGLHELNSGNKLNLQNHVAVNKSLILYNKVKKFIVSIRDKDLISKLEELSNLEDVLENKMPVHKEAWGKEENDPEHNVSERKLGLTPEKRKQLEKEDMLLDEALYNFFASHITLVQDPKQLSKLFTDLDFFHLNDGTLSKEAQDIDDNSFVWWLASRAALKGSKYYAVATTAMDDANAQNLVAPIPTQELGIQAGIAAIYNGNMFKYFGAALTESVIERWKSYSEEDRIKILKNNKLFHTDNEGIPYGMLDTKYQEEETDPAKKKNLSGYNTLYSSDLAVQFVNTLFIEGIAGSGKSTGVFKGILKILFNQNTEIAPGKKLSDYPIFYAHTSKEHASTAISGFDAPQEWKLKAFGKKELLSYFTDDYAEDIDQNTGEYKYYLRSKSPNVKTKVEYNNKTNHYELTWRIKDFSNPDTDIPKIIFIDEFTHYTQLECDFLQRVADKYGIQIIAGGDADQITPTATIYDKGKKVFDAGFNRNTFARVPKLGVSMRTGNGQKTENQNKVRNWQYHRNSTIELTHIEIDGQLYGDKVYNASNDVTQQQLDQIRSDIKKMIASLAPEEKIGYIHSFKKGTNPSAIYKMINAEFKDHFTFYSDTEAQGMEARYYVIENDRSLNVEIEVKGKKYNKARSAEQYWQSLYTGITRASQASIVITPSTALGDKNTGTIKIVNAKVQPDRLIADNYTAQGLAQYTKVRKDNSTVSWKEFMDENYPDNNTTIEQVKLPYLIRSHTSSTQESNSGVKTTTVTQPQSQPSNIEDNTGNGTTASSAPIPPTGNDPNSEHQGDQSTPSDYGDPGVQSDQSNQGTQGSQNNNGPSQSDTGNSIQPSTEIQPSTNINEGEGSPQGQQPSTQPQSESQQPPTPASTTQVISEPSTILEFGTEIYKHNPQTGNYEPIGAVLSFNEETNIYTLTEDGVVPIGQISVDELNDPNGMFQIMDPEQALLSGTYKLLSAFGPQQSVGKMKPGTFIYDTFGIPFGTVISFDVDSKEYIIDQENKGQIRVPQSQIEDTTKYITGVKPTAAFEEGQVLENNGTKIIVQQIRWIDFKPLYLCEVETKEGSRKQSFEEDQLTEFLNKNEPIVDDEVIETPIEDSLPPVVRQDIECGNNSNLNLEEKTSNVEESNNIPQVSFNFFGHTFNTFYTGLHYENGELVRNDDPTQKDRIDCGNGLFKINPTLCTDENNVVKLLGQLRALAWYLDENDTIIESIRKLLNIDDSIPLEIRYAFIIKNGNPSPAYAEKHSRYTPPIDDTLRNTNYSQENEEEQKQVPLKTISLILRRAANPNDNTDLGESLLEIPLITLTSPHNILGQFIKLIESAQEKGADPSSYAHLSELCDNYKKLLEQYKEEGQYKIFSELYNFVGTSKYKDTDDYKVFKDICKIWLFGNNGIKFLKQGFNFCNAFENLGVSYVDEREAEESIQEALKQDYPFRFKGTWKDLSQEAKDRPEVKYSSIMVTKSEEISYDNNSYKLARPGHPFILRYDGPKEYLMDSENVSNRELLELYLQQLSDNIPFPLVTLIYVTPPEVPIMKYLEKLSSLKDNPYGNSFTAYNILACLYREQGRITLDDYLPNRQKSTLRKDLDIYMQDLLDIEDNYAAKDGESRADRLSNIRKLQDDYFSRDTRIRKTLTNALFRIVYGSDSIIQNRRFSEERAIRIQQICNEQGLTGVLWKKRAKPNDTLFNSVLELEHDSSDKYVTPQGDHWRIFGKFDSPTFDVSPLFKNKNSLIPLLARNIVPHKTAQNVSIIQNTLQDNALYEGKTAYNRGNNAAKGADNTPNLKNIEKWQKQYRSQLLKIGVSEQEQKLFGLDCTTKGAFQAAIINHWLSKEDSVYKSNFGFIVGNKVILGNVGQEDLNLFNPTRKSLLFNMTFKSATVDPQDKSIYNLQYEDSNGIIKQVKVKFTSDFKKYSIIINPEYTSDSTTEGTIEPVQEGEQNIQKELDTLNYYNDLLSSFMNPELADSDDVKAISSLFEKVSFIQSLINKKEFLQALNEVKAYNDKASQIFKELINKYSPATRTLTSRNIKNTENTIKRLYPDLKFKNISLQEVAKVPAIVELIDFIQTNQNPKLVQQGKQQLEEYDRLLEVVKDKDNSPEHIDSILKETLALNVRVGQIIKNFKRNSEQSSEEPSTKETSIEKAPAQDILLQEDSDDVITSEDIEKYKLICKEGNNEEGFRDVLAALNSIKQPITSKKALAIYLKENIKDFDIDNDGMVIGDEFFNDPSFFEQFAEDNTEDENNSNFCPIQTGPINVV